MNDYDLLNEETVLREMADALDFDRVKHIARIIKSFRDGFDYTLSSEFAASIEGKSSAYVEMKKRLLQDANRRAEMMERFDRLLVELPGTTELRALVPRSKQSDLDELIRSLDSLRNPE